VTSVQNILVDIHLVHQKAIPLHYTTLVIFLSVVLMLINRYVTIQRELADLNIDLEHKVNQRTQELQAAGEKIIWMKRKEKFIHSFDLTSREKEILELIMEGLSVNGICSRLDISFRTVNNHVYNMYRKMGVHSRMEIIANLDRMAE
jgi:DNA-binding NarL/FixJ family response regulator